jgi:hypothetical protein
MTVYTVVFTPSAHQAVEQAQQYIAEGYRFAVDLDSAAQRLLRLARDSILDRVPVAQPTESPYTDPYVR